MGPGGGGAQLKVRGRGIYATARRCVADGNEHWGFRKCSSDSCVYIAAVVRWQWLVCMLTHCGCVLE